MPRVIWKGSISFGLVHVPVALYPGEQRDELHLSLLDRRDISPVGYKRINKNTEQEVPWDDIVRGYEYEKGQYVLVGDEEFREANVEATQTVEIVDFVAADQIPFVYYDTPYFLEPLRRGEKGYALLREILRRAGYVGVAQVVLRTRQHLAVLRPLEDALVLNLLRYDYELHRTEEFKTPRNDLAVLGISEKEIALGQRLVESMVVAWQPQKYRDEYRDDLLRLVDEKIRAGETHVLHEPKPVAPPEGAEIIDLMSLLKRSVAETRKARSHEKRAGTAKKPRKQA